MHGTTDFNASASFLVPPTSSPFELAMTIVGELQKRFGAQVTSVDMIGVDRGEIVLQLAPINADLS
jgi:hypothetical protein